MQAAYKKNSIIVTETCHCHVLLPTAKTKANLTKKLCHHLLGLFYLEQE